MTNNITQLKIGSRGSSLALVQTKLVIEALKKIPEIKKKFSFKIIKFWSLSVSDLDILPMKLKLINPNLVQIKFLK